MNLNDKQSIIYVIQYHIKNNSGIFFLILFNLYNLIKIVIYGTSVN